MRQRTITLLAAALLAVISLVASGCGSTAPKPKPKPGPAANSASADRALFTSKNCQQLVDLPVTFADGLTGVNDGLAATHTVLTAFARQSLFDIRPDFEVLAAATVKIAAVIKSADVTPGKPLTPHAIAKLRELSSVVDTDTVTDDSSFVSTWAQKNCPGTA